MTSEISVGSSLLLSKHRGHFRLYAIDKKSNKTATSVYQLDAGDLPTGGMVLHLGVDGKTSDGHKVYAAEITCKVKRQ